MDTRGVYGYRVGQQDHLIIAASDSYPTGLGYTFLYQLQGYIKTSTLPALQLQISAITPNPEADKFIRDTVNCEWSYICNLDFVIFEIYKGGRTKHHSKGRYAAATPVRGYYPVALVAEIPFKDVVEIDVKQWATDLEMRYPV